MRKKILIVEDEAIIAADLRGTLAQAGYEVCGIANSVSKALEVVDSQKPYLVIIDIYLKGDLTGIDLAHALNKRDIPFIYLSANCNHQVLEEAKMTSPYGFLVKPFRDRDLLITLDIAFYRYEHHLQIKEQPTGQLHSESPPAARSISSDPRKSRTQPLSLPNFEGIIGGSKSMMHIFDLIRQVASLNTSVLILGESGTGKEGVAACIHNLSPRKEKAFVKINCAALPMHLVESELFGHEKGAFTGAYERKIGKFERANGGTVFLDEIGEMSSDIQVKLLRVLQEREIERVGGNMSLKVDVRVIAATNRNLEKAIAKGEFRLDLYYRLNVFPINMPPLRARAEDIPLLVTHFIDLYSRKAGKTVDSISDSAMRELVSYTWPGNVRELQNLIERSVLLARGDTIENIDLPTPFRDESFSAPAEIQQKTIAEMEREHILAVLKKCNHRVSGPGGAAEFLNLPPSTLSSKIKKLGIIRKH